MDQSKKTILIKTIIGCALFVLAIAIIIVATTIKRPVVTFVNDDGTVIAQVKTAIGKTAVAPDTSNLKSTKLSKRGYNAVFSRWEPSIENIQEDITVEAQYVYVPYIYSISLDLNGGTFKSGVTAPTFYTIEDSVILPSPERTGCTFKGWIDTTTNQIVSSMINVGTIGQKSLKASWNAPSHTITYNLDGGSCKNLLESYTILDKITLPTPTKEGMVFSGWYTSDDFSEESKITVIENMDYDITLYAEWSYNVSFELNDGILERLVQKTYAPQKGYVLPIPRKVGYRFAGWYTDMDYSTQIEKIKPSTTGDITVYAKWEQVENGVVFTENGYKYIFFGSYAQSVVTDQSIIDALNKLEDKNVKVETIALNGKNYVKVEANPFDSLYQFDYNTPYTITPTKQIKNGTKYYFNIDPIKWRILSEESDRYLLLSEYVLDVSTFDEKTEKTSASNNYETSKIRKWLNETFFNNAFTLDEQKRILEVEIDNSADTSYSFTNPNKYNNTKDLVFMLSYKDVTNALYGFKSSFDVSDPLKDAKASEYVRARGLAMTMLYASYASCNWMLRSAFSNTTSISIVKCLGNLLTDPIKIIERAYSVENNCGVRPAIYLAK